jgi:hypothetical protein
MIAPLDPDWYRRGTRVMDKVEVAGPRQLGTASPPPA